MGVVVGGVAPLAEDSVLRGGGLDDGGRAFLVGAGAGNGAHLAGAPCGIAHADVVEHSLAGRGDIRYCNRLACKNCKNKCTTAAFREADFSKDKLVMKVGGRVNKKTDDKPGTGVKISKSVVTRKVVRYRFKLDEKKMNERK